MSIEDVKQGEVQRMKSQVWRMEILTDGHRMEKALGLLTPDERQRAARYHHEEDRRRFVTGRALVRCLLSKKLGIEAQQVVLTQTAMGKPEASAAYFFNVSHAGGQVIVGLSQTHPVGIDIEQVSAPNVDWKDVVGAVFSPEEIASCRRGEDALAACAIWTAKEALLKAWGCGLNANTKALTILPDGSSFSVRCQGAPMTDANLTLLDVPSGYLAVLALADVNTLTIEGRAAINPQIM